MFRQDLGTGIWTFWEIEWGESFDGPGPVACFSDGGDVSEGQSGCCWPLRGESVARCGRHMQERLVCCCTCLEGL